MRLFMLEEFSKVDAEKWGGEGGCLQVEESELTCGDAVLVYEAAGEVAAEDGSEVVLGHLSCQ